MPSPGGIPLLSAISLQDAVANGSRETVLYVPAIVPGGTRPDYLATVDADPTSATYSQVCRRGRFFLRCSLAPPARARCPLPVASAPAHRCTGI